MRYKTLFRVLQKLLGVWLCAQGVCAAVSGVLRTLIQLVEMGPAFGPGVGIGSVLLFFVWPLGGVLQAVLGLYLFFGAAWIADLAIPGNRPYCHECGYALTTTTRDECPECGTAFAPQSGNAAQGS